MLQKLIYEGYLGADPELKYLPNGTGVTNFRIGSSRKYKSKDGATVEETTWLKVAVFGAMAEIVHKYAHKGSHVIIEGSLRPAKDGSPSVYEKKDGTWAASFDVVATSVRLLDSKGDSKDEPQKSSAELAEDDANIPF